MTYAVEWAAWIYVALTVLVCLFQAALAAGAPWGSLAMGGRHPGRFPPALRVAAFGQLALLAALAVVVASRAGLVLPEARSVSRVWIWVVVAISGVSLVLNSITPSRWERRLWAPVALAMTASSLAVALAS